MQGRYTRSEQRYSQDYETVEDNNEPSVRVISSATTATTYDSAIAPRLWNIQRSRPSALRPGELYRATGISSFQSSIYALVPSNANNTPTAIGTINLNRLREKRDLAYLNDKFAQYIEKLRFLEVQNRKLKQELDVLQRRSHQGSSNIKEMFDTEIREARKLIDATSREAANVKQRRQQKEGELQDLEAQYKILSGHQQTDRQQIDVLQQQIAENEAQIAVFRRRLADIEDESRVYKNGSQRLAADLARLHGDIQQESLLRTSCEVEKAHAEDELAHLKQIQEAELAEIRARNISSDLDPSLFFRNELASAIQEIRNDYETAAENQRQNLQLQYSMLTQKYSMYTTSANQNAVPDAQAIQIKKLQEEFLTVKNRNAYLRAENRTFENNIKDIEERLRDLADQERAAQERSERDFEDLRRRAERIEGDHKNVTTLKTDLEREIGEYRELLEGQNGLSGYITRIEQSAIDRPGPGRISGGNAGAGTISRTFINKTSSNYYRAPTSTISGLVNQSNAPATSYQGFTGSPRRPETREAPSSNYGSRENLTSGYETRAAPATTYQSRDTSSNNYQPRDAQPSPYQFRDNQAGLYQNQDYQGNGNYQSRNNQSSNYASREAVINEPPVTMRTSLIRDSSIGSRTSLLRDSIRSENRRSTDYDTLSNS